MGRIIALSGAHGTGKTTAAFQLAYELKKRMPTDIGFVREVARECPFAIHGKFTKSSYASQQWIFAAQQKKELELSRLHRLTVSDRSIVDSIGYSIALGYDGLAAAHTSMARHHIHLYERIIFRRISDNPFMTDDGLRDGNAKFAVEVEKAMLSAYRDLHINVEFDTSQRRVIETDEFWQSLIWAMVK